MKLTIRRLGIHSAVAALSLLASFPAVSATSNFNSTTEGWTVSGDFATPVTWNSTGGNPDGYVSVVDQVDGGTMLFIAPAAYLGNQSSAYGTALTFSLRQDFTGSPDQFTDDGGDVVLSSSTLTLAYKLPTNPANGAWTSYSVLLTAAAGWHVSLLSGAAATETDMHTVLSDLTGLSIRAEYQSGPDTDGLDSVNLFAPSATPIPAALPLFGSGLAALGLAGWRRKKKAAATAV